VRDPFLEGLVVEKIGLPKGKGKGRTGGANTVTETTRSYEEGERKGRKVSATGGKTMIYSNEGRRAG